MHNGKASDNPRLHRVFHRLQAEKIGFIRIVNYIL